MGTEVNIITVFAKQAGVTGPGKTLRNLLAGLERIGQQYEINRSMFATSRIYVHSDMRALLELPNSGSVHLLGPNLGVLPRDLPTRRGFPHSFYLQPSDWALEAWVREGFKQCSLRRYPSGIDTDRWCARQPTSKDAPILLYYKNRFPAEYERVERELRSMDLSYIPVKYGSYEEDDYLKALHQCSFIIWLGTPESQGIALQEALASNVPILVLDALSVFDVCAEGYKFPERLRSLRSTSAPYFDERCGQIINTLDGLGDGIAYMFDHLDEFKPRDYVLENLTLEVRAKAFMDLFRELEEVNATNDRTEQPDKDAPFAPSTLTTLQARAYWAIRNPRHATARLLCAIRFPGDFDRQPYERTPDHTAPSDN